MRIVASELEDEIQLETYSGPVSGAAAAITSKRNGVPPNLALFFSYKGYEDAIDSTDSPACFVPAVSRIRRFSEVCDKGMLTHLLQSSVDRDVHASRWLPPSCVLPRDASTVEAFLERAAVSTGCVILKPCDGAKGNGIKLFPLLCRRRSASANSTTAVTSVGATEDDKTGAADPASLAAVQRGILAECARQGRSGKKSASVIRPAWLLQEYVSAPLLLRGRKFDLRLYLLLVLAGDDGNEDNHDQEIENLEPERARGSSMWAHQESEQQQQHQQGEAVTGRGSREGKGRSAPTSAHGRHVRAYLCRHGLARLCSQPYAEPTRANASVVTMHLTNFAVNKAGAPTAATTMTAAQAPPVPLKLTAWEALREIEAESSGSAAGEEAKDALTAECLWRQAETVASGVARALAPTLLAAADGGVTAKASRAVRDSKRVPSRQAHEQLRSQKTHPKHRECRFQVSGLDIMFDALGRPVLLELNANPSLDISGPDGVTVCAVDRDVKVPMLRDAIRIAVLGPDDGRTGGGSSYAPSRRHEGQGLTERRSSPGSPSATGFFDENLEEEKGAGGTLNDLNESKRGLEFDAAQEQCDETQRYCWTEVLNFRSTESAVKIKEGAGDTTGDF